MHTFVTRVRYFFFHISSKKHKCHNCNQLKLRVKWGGGHARNERGKGLCLPRLNKIKGSTHTLQHRVEEHCQVKNINTTHRKKGGRGR